MWVVRMSVVKGDRRGEKICWKGDVKGCEKRYESGVRRYGRGDETV